MAFAADGLTPLRCHDLQVMLPIIVEARIVVEIGQIEIDALFQAQTELFDAALDHRRPADQDRTRQAFIDHGLHRTQHGFLFAFGIHHALDIGARAFEHRFHQQTGPVHELRQLITVQVDVRHVAGGDAGQDRGLGHGRRQ